MSATRNDFFRVAKLVAAFWLAVFGVIVLASMLVGCVAQAQGSHDSSEVIYHPRTGQVVYQRETGEHVKQSAAPNAAGPSTITMSDDGSSASTAGSQEKPLEAYLGEQRQTIFYTAGIGLILAGVAAFVWLNRVAGITSILAGLGLCFMPDILKTAGPSVGAMVAGVFGLLLVGGVAWALASFYRTHRENLSGVASALKLGTEGATREAVAALRETPLARAVKGKQ